MNTRLIALLIALSVPVLSGCGNKGPLVKATPEPVLTEIPDTAARAASDAPTPPADPSATPPATPAEPAKPVDQPTIPEVPPADDGEDGTG